MATSVPSLVPAPALSQRVRRAALKKERRKRKRQALAQARECGVKNGGTTTEEEENDENAEKESQQLHEEWLERERVAQEEFKLKHEREEAARKRKEEEEHKIKAEWEAQQKREQDEQDKKQQEKRDREEAVQKMLDQAESQLDNGGPWMNPEAPVTENSANYGTERDIANCPFFLKTGSCRFGESPTLLIRGMFVTFGMEQCRRDDYDTDACLEHSEEELQDYFLEFYHDVLPEFRSVGKVVQFKVSCNFEPHLRGNVYVQFDTEDQCREAFLKFNGRWYAGRQLHCQLCPVTRWKNAICGLFDRKKCPKGKNCNFLHVFRNPGNEFWEADRDLHISPDRSGESTHKMGRYSERYGERSWRQRHSSRSPPRSERSHSRRGGEKRRSRSRSRERSRDTRASHCQREDSIQSERRSSRYRPTSSRKDRYRSKSRDRGRNRDRSRSGSRDGERDRLWNESRDEDRGQNKHKGRSREKDRSRSRSGDRERKKQIREKGSTQSPKKPDWRDETGDVNTHTHRQHKRSKKSKKKSKKKHKKKTGHFPEVVTSSGDSEKEEEIEEKKEKEHFPVTSPSKKVNEVDLDWRAGDHMDLNSDSQNDENKSTPEIKSNKSHLEIPADLTGNGDSCTH